MIINLSILFYMLVCLCHNSVVSFQNPSVVNEKYRAHILPPSGEARNLFEERIFIERKNYWATSCKEIFRKIRETEAEYRYSLYLSYPLFPDIPYKCLQNTLRFYKWINDKETGSRKYVLCEYTEQQLMVPCFSTEASIPADIEENNLVSDFVEFWIYPAIGTLWMLIKYDPNANIFVLMDLHNVEVFNDNLVPSKIFSTPIPTSIRDESQLVEKLSNAQGQWSSWIKSKSRINRNILTTVRWNGIVTLCVAFIGQYIRKEEKLTNFNLKVNQQNSTYSPRVHIKRSVANKYEETDETTSNSKINTSQKSLSVYIEKLDGNQWKEIGVTMGYKCPVLYGDSLTDFYLAWATEENSILFVRYKKTKRIRKGLKGEIVEMTENVHELHLRHLYFNSFV